MKIFYLITAICLMLLVTVVSVCTPLLWMQFGDESLPNKLVHVFWLCSPVFFLFFIFRIVRIRPILALFLTSFVLVGLTLISHKKQTITGVPLNFEDLIAVYNLSIAIKYMPSISYVYILMIAIWLVLVYHSEKVRFPKEPFHISTVFFLLLTTPFTFYIYLQNNWLIDTKYYQDFTQLVKDFNVNYNSESMSDNIYLHGLPMHIMQTSSIILPKYNPKQQQEFLSYNRQSPPLLANAPRTIIYILCESCWNDQKHLRQYFQPLFDLGFTESRAISPVYGGGTANSEFEMLTGLPTVNKNVAGIIYQQYVNDIRKDADTLPRHLRQNGYITYAGHNDIPKFYNRDQIYPKFGFDEYQSINDMGTLPEEYVKQRKPWQHAEDDYLLFNTAIKRLKAAHGKKIFMHLLTMNTHGYYHKENEDDDGVAAYTLQLQQSISRMQQFFTQVAEIDPNALIVMYGDHKPGLTSYFVKNHIMASGDISRGPSNYGDVPVFIKSPDKEKVQQLIEESNHKPFYCLTNAVDSIFIGARLYTFNYMQQQGCLTPGEYNYDRLSNRATGKLYGLSLF